MIKILLIVLSIIICVAIIVTISLIWRKTFERFLDIKEKEVKNKKYEIFNNINIDTVNEVVDSYIESYINRYILYKFMSQKIMYINAEDTTDLISDVTKNILLDISELYLYYIQLLYSIDDDDMLAVFIKNRVMNKAIEITTSYNSSMVPEQE